MSEKLTEGELLGCLTFFYEDHFDSLPGYPLMAKQAYNQIIGIIEEHFKRKDFREKEK